MLIPNQLHIKQIPHRSRLYLPHPHILRSAYFQSAGYRSGGPARLVDVVRGGVGFGSHGCESGEKGEEVSVSL